jgi:hypothetical protein
MKDERRKTKDERRKRKGGGGERTYFQVVRGTIIGSRLGDVGKVGYVAGLALGLGLGVGSGLFGDPVILAAYASEGEVGVT